MDYMHYQRMPHIHGDLEPAFVVPPHEPCCPDEKEECMCITSGEVEKWNEAADMLSALSGITPEDLDNVASAVSALASAEYWNSNYNTVKDNSANWDSAYNAVTASAKIWNSAINIPELTDAVNDLTSALSALDGKKANNFYVDSASIIGDGSIGSPYRVADWARISALNYNFNELNSHLFPADSADGFTGDMIITDGARAKFLELQPEHELLMSFMRNIDTHISGINNRINEAEQLSYKAISEAKTYYGDGSTTVINEKYSSPSSSGSKDDPKTREYVVSVIGLPAGYDERILSGVRSWEYISANLVNREFLSWESTNYPRSNADISACRKMDTIYVAVE